MVLSFNASSQDIRTFLENYYKPESIVTLMNEITNYVNARNKVVIKGATTVSSVYVRQINSFINLTIFRKILDFSRTTEQYGNILLDLDITQKNSDILAENRLNTYIYRKLTNYVAPKTIIEMKEKIRRDYNFENEFTFEGNKLSASVTLSRVNISQVNTSYNRDLHDMYLKWVEELKQGGVIKDDIDLSQANDLFDLGLIAIIAVASVGGLYLMKKKKI